MFEVKFEFNYNPVKIKSNSFSGVVNIANETHCAGSLQMRRYGFGWEVLAVTCNGQPRPYWVGHTSPTGYAWYRGNELVFHKKQFRLPHSPRRAARAMVRHIAHQISPYYGDITLRWGGGIVETY